MGDTKGIKDTSAVAATFGEKLISDEGENLQLVCNGFSARHKI